MKPWIVVLYKGSGEFGPFLVTAETKERAVKYAVREIIKAGKFPNPPSDNTCKAVVQIIKRKWVNSETPGLQPLEVHPYGNGFLVVYKKKTDKIELTAM